MDSIINLIKKKRNLNDNTNSYKYDNIEGFFILEGISNDTDQEEKYIICNYCDLNHKFDIEIYNQIIDKEEGISIPIFIFQNWQDEIDQYMNVYEKLNAKNKKMLMRYFDNKISVYRDTCDSLKITVDDEINYLEYHSNDISDFKLDGYIYNISLWELKKLFNITGVDLFKKNVRQGLRRNSTGDEIKKSFRNYMFVDIQYQLQKMSIISKKDEQFLLDILEIDSEMTENCIPEKFWFYHNGITLYSYNDSPLNRCGNQVTINPNNVSVINGAQTMTNFYTESELIKIQLPKILEDFNIDKNLINELVDNACKKIIVKTIIIKGDEKYVRPITYGLNTQIPILSEHIIADSPIVQDLNVYLQKAGMKILKSGECSPYGKGFDVVDFIKKYLMIINQPGTSKNLRKADINKYIKQASEDIKNEAFMNSSVMLDKLDILIYIDSWWKSSKTIRFSNFTEPDAIIFNSYSKNYFCSYVLHHIYDEYDDNYLMVLYERFINDFSMLKSPTLEDFKKDDLFDEYLKIAINKKTSIQSKIKINYDELKDFVITNKRTEYSISNIIAQYLLTNAIDIGYFRVITQIDGKCTECYPFPSSCFNELIKFIESDDEENQDIFVTFENSEWKKHLQNKFIVFVIDKNNSGEINKISMIEKFSFENYLVDAEYIFNKTVEAFEKGDESLFPKSSIHKSFHIRPKARNAEDTFEFSNGERITKRTFWANKDTVNKIIQARLYN